MDLYPLPEGYTRCTSYEQLFKLKKRKKIWNPENITRRNGQVVFIYSEVAEGFYRRVLHPHSSEEILQKYIDRQILFYKTENDE